MSGDPPPLASLSVDIAAMRRRKQDRHQIAVELPRDWLRDVLSETDALVDEAGRASLTLHLPTEGAVIATGDLRLTFRVPCGRCLEPATVVANTPITATFSEGDALPEPSGPRGADDEEPGLGLSADDLDTWLFDGRELRLDPMLMDHVRVAYPMRVLCHRGDACRGLCPSCGRNLNPDGGELDRKPCSVCAPSSDGVVDASSESPLAAALKRIRLDD